MEERDIVLSITLVIFSISFAWMVNERIREFPKIRRFAALFSVFGLIHKATYTNEKRRRIKSDFIVLISSWPIIIIFLCVSINSLLAYYDSYCIATHYQLVSNRYIIPALFFIAPQFTSRLISSIVLWAAKDEIRYLWNRDRNIFSVFSTAWKEEHGLTDTGIANGTIHKAGRKRTIISFLFLVIIYVLIFFL